MIERTQKICATCRFGIQPSPDVARNLKALFAGMAERESAKPVVGETAKTSDVLLKHGAELFRPEKLLTCTHPEVAGIKAPEELTKPRKSACNVDLGRDPKTLEYIMGYEPN